MSPQFEMRLELVPVPVSDVDRAIEFYVNQLGFHLDHDHIFPGGQRVCQLTPPGSGCSILLSAGLDGIQDMAPGTLRGLHLVVADAQALYDEMSGRGVPVSPLVEMGGVKYVGFSDPDGNTWTFQEIGSNVRRPDTL